MISNFTAELQGHTFQFNTMSSKTLFLFQVYVPVDSVRKRFHMQRDTNDGRFKIMDRDTCPDFCLPLEAALHEAILENHERMNQAQ